MTRRCEARLPGCLGMATRRCLGSCDDRGVPGPGDHAPLDLCMSCEPRHFDEKHRREFWRWFGANRLDWKRSDSYALRRVS